MILINHTIKHNTFLRCIQEGTQNMQCFIDMCAAASPAIFDIYLHTCIHIYSDQTYNYIFVDDYESLELLIQAILFVFHQPEIVDPLTLYGTYTNLEDLKHELNLTKYGTTDEECSKWDYIVFSNIYRGNSPKVRQLLFLFITYKCSSIADCQMKQNYFGCLYLEIVNLCTLVIVEWSSSVCNDYKQDDNILC